LWKIKQRRIITEDIAVMKVEHNALLSFELRCIFNISECGLVMHSIAFVCVSVSVCPIQALTFESINLETFIFGWQVHLQNIWAKVKYQGHGVKVKVI